MVYGPVDIKNIGLYAGKMGVGCKTLMAYQSMFLWKMNVWLSMVALVVRLCEADQQMHLLALQN